jgi:hypothetical protein
VSPKPSEFSLDDILDPVDAVDREMGEAAAEGVELTDDEPRDPAWCAFEVDLRAGLRLVKRQAMAAINEGRHPKKVSVAWVLREAGRGRSQFYVAHTAFEARITLVQEAVERLLARRARQTTRSPSKTALLEESRELRARLKEMEAREISKLATIAFEKAFPRDVALLAVENTKLRADVFRLEGEVETLRAYIRSLSKHQDIPSMKIGNVEPLQR